MALSFDVVVISVMIGRKFTSKNVNKKRKQVFQPAFVSYCPLNCSWLTPVVE